MAEQRALVAQIKFQDPWTRTIIGKGLTTAYIVNALRDYFNDNTKPHYWEVDTSVVGGNYDIFTNAAPYDTPTNKHTSLVLKPKTGAPGGTAQRIVFITRGHNSSTTAQSWGGLQIGYLPDGAFDSTNGVNHSNDSIWSNVVISTAPTTWSTFREITSSTSNPQFLLNEFTVVEYRDDPSIHSDPGQSLFIALHSENNINDWDYANVNQFVWTDRKMFKWQHAALIGRTVQPFTRYHEEAIGNKGDAMFIGIFDNQITLASRPMAEAGSTAGTFINDSAIVRVAPNCWAMSYPHYGGIANTFLQTDASHHNIGNWKQPVPIPIAGSPNNTVRNGLHVSTVNSFSTYGYTKQLKSLPYSAGGWDGSWLTSDTPGSYRAWAKFPNNKSTSFNNGRVLLWDKEGPQMLSYLQ